MALSFISVDILSGSVVTDLPDLTMQGPMPQTMMRYESQTCMIPLDTAPVNWRSATRPYSAVVICLNDDTKKTPLWGGIVVDRATDETDNITLSLATVESYMDRVYIGNETFTATDQNTLVKNLISKYVSRPGGIPLRVQVVGPAGMRRDRAYLDTDDKTIYSVLTELSAVISGPEWICGWEYRNNAYTPVLYVGTRIGNPVTPGLGPNTVFNMPGPVSKAKLVESYATGSGANDVMASSSGIGAARPQSPHQRPDNMAGRPITEHRFTPSTSITTILVLTGHAQRALAAIQNGTMALTITADRRDSPQLGDWGLGDDVGFDLTTRAWTNGFAGTARVIGWQIDNNTVTPILDASLMGGLDTINIPHPTAGTALVNIYPGATLFPSSTTYPA